MVNSKANKIEVSRFDISFILVMISLFAMIVVGIMI
jgi:hypothetical protein